MPDIEAHGYHLSSTKQRIRELLADAPYSKDISFEQTIRSEPVNLMSNDRDQFLRIYGSATWMRKYKVDLLRRLCPHYGVEIVPIEWHPRKT